jgi:putative ABC transport system permease protein
MALGADRGDVVKMVLRGAFSQVGIGLLLGLPLAIVAGRLMTAKLYGVTGFDPLILAGAVGALALCALVAGAVPARRAASIEPVQALRVE